MKIPYTINPGRHRALELLLTRYSPWPLVGPVPSDEELVLVFAAALRAADHGRLQPWCFVLVREGSLSALGDAYVGAARAPGQDIYPYRARAKAVAAPMIIAVDARIDRDHVEPASMVGRVVDFQAFGDGPSLFRRKDLIQGGDLVGVQVVQHQANDGGLRVENDQMLHGMGEIPLGALCGDQDLAEAALMQAVCSPRTLMKDAREAPIR